MVDTGRFQVIGDTWKGDSEWNGRLLVIGSGLSCFASIPAEDLSLIRVIKSDLGLSPGDNGQPLIMIPTLPTYLTYLTYLTYFTLLFWVCTEYRSYSSYRPNTKWTATTERDMQLLQCPGTAPIGTYSQIPFLLIIISCLPYVR